MNRLILSLLALAGMMYSVGCQTAKPVAMDGPPIAIIPEPAELHERAGAFQLTAGTRLYVEAGNDDARAAAEYLAGKLRRSSGYELPIREIDGESARRGGVVFTSKGDDAGLPIPPEGYRLVVVPDGVVVRAGDGAGFFYGAQTIRQLLPPAIESTSIQPGPWPMHCVVIRDQPRFPWRGYMLDCSRHFQSKEFLLGFLDDMAYYKLNTLHWHLVDNDGWRLQIDRYPELTEVAAWRGDGADREGGFYTKDDVRDILARAAELHINIVPEIEMPAHVNCVLWTHPELSCSGKGWERGTKGRTVYTDGVGMIPYCAGRDETFTFVENILDEVVDLFPSRVIHVGGDERPHGFWSECPRCQARMKAEGLADENELQTWFMRRITDYLASKGRRATSWGVATGDLYNPSAMADIGNNSILQNWHGGAAVAAAQGWDVVNSDSRCVYFDYPQFEGDPGASWMALTPIEKVYAFDPMAEKVDAWRENQILGSEACLWTEGVPEDRVEHQTFPRLLALSEIVWTPREKKDFPDFQRRATSHEPRMTAMGIDFARPPAE